jgi:CMP-N,N'-diacetyllegionaminic acid synthase
MYNHKKILAFIGARKGSKGLKNKNILNLCGRPLICWTIQAALGSKYIDRTLISTDGENIARISKAAGADVPFLRPAKLATDKAPIEGAIRHALDWIEKNDKNSYDYLLLLQPTSPLRTSRHIDDAIKHYFRHRQTPGDTLVSVNRASPKTGWLMGKNSKGYIDFCFGLQDHRRQNIPSYYLPNGLIYLAPTKVIRRVGFYSSHTLPFVMDEKASVDIDSREDFKHALKMLSP